MPSKSSSSEPVVQASTLMPKGYVFVPKGNVYITLNCRRKTQTAHKTVYQVIDKSRKMLGIRVPRFIRDEVRSSEASTRQDRSAAVQKRDMALENEFRRALLKTFPETPEESVTKIVSHAMRKSSGRVGRCGRLAVGSKAIMGVRAHIRHCHTDYDGLLRGGMSRDAAREKTLAKVDEIARAWGGGPGGGWGPKKVPKKTKHGSAAKHAKASQAAKSAVGRQARENLLPKKLKVQQAKTIPATRTAVRPTSSRIGRSVLQNSGDDESDEFAWSDSKEDDDSDRAPQ